ncbi:MAG: TIGR03960 family B12-binding radical SAM protein [Spirochaetaceae bacterium]|jgi:radical SAM family uncharacterized protein/radical SAM-linked protein|nr:TIGR03960 family B12-binding radical SAM protein [Spirochaetaceae bacterium]
MQYINIEEIAPLLAGVAQPARYVGGEYGRLTSRKRHEEAALRAVVAFPDLYEIGMANQALRIIYKGINEIEGPSGSASCDRVFAPAPDFEEALAQNDIPLYGLDSGLSIKDHDFLLVTMAYELGLTGFLSILKASGIPLRAEDRGEDDPIVIMGGPCISNPLPYSLFVDAFWIGEAEAGFFELMKDINREPRQPREQNQQNEQNKNNLKCSRGSRGSRLNILYENPHIWMMGKEKAVRAIYSGFGKKSDPAIFPIPSMKITQMHGAVEIMRGCPNGCRFCHAGIWYRPMRQKPVEIVFDEASSFIQRGGYHEISLSSLSTGDYCGLSGLLDHLNAEFADKHVSFQLPSLRVSTFSLPLLEKVSAVRKSGLTFAVETPTEMQQLMLNKRVIKEDLIAIIKEAKERGWRGMKFYFMIGLPGCKNDADDIINFINDIAYATKLNFNINVGTFVPKPHTPFQWAEQIDEKTAMEQLTKIKSALRPKGHKVSFNDPFVSTLEGIISRGGEEVGVLIEQAFNEGARLDAWDEYFKKDIWRKLIGVRAGSACPSNSPYHTPLPWNCIESGTTTAYLQKEAARAAHCELSPLCDWPCKEPCGVCNKNIKLTANDANHANDGVTNDVGADNYPPLRRDGKGVATLRPNNAPTPVPGDTSTHRILFTFSKKSPAIWLSHLSLIEVFSMALTRSGLPVAYTQGFNPLPVLSFAAPLSVGMSALAEVASLDFTERLKAETFISALNPCFPEGLHIEEALAVDIPQGAKKHSVPSLLWGFTYQAGEQGPSNAVSVDTVPADAVPVDAVPAKEEKAYRMIHPRAIRSGCLAKGQRPYFEVYRELYKMVPGTLEDSYKTFGKES